MNILIIDDDRFLTNSLKVSLESHNHHVTVLNKASELMNNIDIIRKHELILLDLMMRKPPELNLKPGEETGEALFREIKNVNKDIPVIIVTGKDANDIKTKFSKFGTQVLLKPFNARLEDLHHAIERAYAH